MISTKNLSEAHSLIKKSKEKPIIIQAQDDDFNRKILEHGKFDILLFPDKEKRKDKLKQSDSGLNHVLAKIAAKNKISIGYDLEKIITLEKKEKAIQLSRLIQNIK